MNEKQVRSAVFPEYSIICKAFTGTASKPPYYEFQDTPELTVACAESLLALWRISVVIAVFCVNSAFLVASVTDLATVERKK